MSYFQFLLMYDVCQSCQTSRRLGGWTACSVLLLYNNFNFFSIGQRIKKNGDGECRVCTTGKDDQPNIDIYTTDCIAILKVSYILGYPL